MKSAPSRLEQLGNLLTAMIAVIVSGRSDLMLTESPANEAPQSAPGPWVARIGKHPHLPHEVLVEFGSGGKYHRVCARVAARLGRTQSHVHNVAFGKNPSLRIMAEIQSEIKAVDEHLLARLPEKAQVLSAEVLAQISRNGQKYYGIYPRLARQLGVSAYVVRYVARGVTKNDRIFAALLSEVARIDSEYLGYGDPKPLTKDELRHFLVGRRYFGVNARVSRRLGISDSACSGVAHGKQSNTRILSAIRAEMARIDAEIAMRGGQL